MIFMQDNNYAAFIACQTCKLQIFQKLFNGNQAVIYDTEFFGLKILYYSSHKLPIQSLKNTETLYLKHEFAKSLINRNTFDCYPDIEHQLQNTKLLASEYQFNELVQIFKNHKLVL